MAAFQNREAEIIQICVESDQSVLVNVFGEAGIGKSRLLDEATARLGAQDPPALVLKADLGRLPDVVSGEALEELLRELARQVGEELTGPRQDAEQVPGRIVARLTRLAFRKPVILMFDTTETFQEDVAFWEQMETHLVGPLVVEGKVRQVFAGRVPVPWRRIEVRRVLKQIRLEPLPRKDAARSLTQEVLQQHNPDIDSEVLEQAIDLGLEFSFGHPLLSEKLATYMGPRWPVPSPDAFRRELCERIVKPFVDEDLFASTGVESPWDEILWWASVLDWFDATVLQRYLNRVAPDLIKDWPDYFFIQGINHLRLQNTVVWREVDGDRLHGVIGDVVRHCLQVLDPPRYRRACQAAAETFEELADEFPAESLETQKYHREAEKYRLRPKEMER